MPRPTRHQGRPGTTVIPADWSASHAVVAAKTFTAPVEVFDPAAGTEPALQADFTYSAGAVAAPIFTGSARIQVMNGQAADILGEQQVLTALYLVVVDRAADIPVGSRVLVGDGVDPLLDGRHLIVRKAAGGSLRWERDLWCVDDMTYEPEGA